MGSKIIIHDFFFRGSNNASLYCDVEIANLHSFPLSLSEKDASHRTYYVLLALSSLPEVQVRLVDSLFRLIRTRTVLTEKIFAFYRHCIWYMLSTSHAKGSHQSRSLHHRLVLVSTFRL